ncbi:Protein involved in Zinc homeostasis [Komagataella phaffii CBS 7435]|uniref:Plasma membrane protein involved in zinc metabolism and osmotin-induced apoptosis n=2 Tax=Komagataella phaffii TaxID=460519 RepID=C4R6I9_KOMPG|nr:Plasma membrane protein involved in zinc metabolism and osmotin-induced apoptosis [Komagataella phaffii GS115]AOA63400.1 GQ67_04249T0 [Komagataella phaffii]CAH2448979.1 Protein involved in Zinc homeostasis [Komagataella phaffii CBS 7435]AOA69008.1 GQ68_04221T0 [Komagataella phaffii GS115]CAY71175.1 Plasma membrane protein involved in zinc metabolism and osmotin-induced apoptosis [Komagataella phaffii GS115]SCV12146.1 Protein involved in Zinc homeostasis [Komagataella phaffii CBS 7435]
MAIKRRGTYEAVVDNTVSKHSPVKKIQQLAKYHELPDWMKDNHFILGSYVSETSSFKACFRSLTYVHNESANIYTHLIPALVSPTLAVFFAFILFQQNAFEQTFNHSAVAVDYVVCSLFLFGLFGCFMCSACFHCFKSHSHKIAIVGNKLDYLGIVLLISTSLIGIIYYAFIDKPNLYSIMISVTVILAIVCATVSLDDNFRRPEWRPFRASMFVSFGLWGGVPVLVGLYTYGKEETVQRCGLKFIILEAIFYILGASIYALRVPERLAPGSFDLLGSSHQIFHVLVVIAAVCHGMALVGSYNYSKLTRV